MHATENGLRRS